jgi:hypothetical protein
MRSEQQAKRHRKREHPLAHRHPGDDVLDQVSGLPMNGVVRVQAEAKLVSWSDRVRKPPSAACTESFSLHIGGR